MKFALAAGIATLFFAEGVQAQQTTAPPPNVQWVLSQPSNALLLAFKADITPGFTKKMDGTMSVDWGSAKFCKGKGVAFQASYVVLRALGASKEGASHPTDMPWYNQESNCAVIVPREDILAYLRQYGAQGYGAVQRLDFAKAPGITDEAIHEVQETLRVAREKLIAEARAGAHDGYMTLFADGIGVSARFTCVLQDGSRDSIQKHMMSAFSGLPDKIEQAGYENRHGAKTAAGETYGLINLYTLKKSTIVEKADAEEAYRDLIDRKNDGCKAFIGRAKQVMAIADGLERNGYAYALPASFPFVFTQERLEQTVAAADAMIAKQKEEDKATRKAQTEWLARYEAAGGRVGDLCRQGGMIFQDVVLPSIHGLPFESAKKLFDFMFESDRNAWSYMMFSLRIAYRNRASMVEDIVSGEWQKACVRSVGGA